MDLGLQSLPLFSWNSSPSLHLTTCIFTILNELRLDIHTTIVRFEDLEFPPRLVFNQGSKDFEEVKNIRLTLEEIWGLKWAL